MHSLRARILAAIAAVVALSLFLASVATLALLVDYQRRVTLTRQQVLVATVANDLSELLNPQHPALPVELRQRLRRDALALGGRFLVTDGDGKVLQDTAASGNLEGQRIRLPGQGVLRAWRRFRAPDGHVYYAISVPLQRPAAREAGEPPQRYLVLALRAEELRQAWRDTVLLLAWAALLATAVALVVGYFLSRSITRPLRALTRATQEVARGHYEQRVPVQGDDELAQLAQSFNSMAQEVQHARQMERDLLANVTHDLRTPLTSIQGFSQALLEGAADDPASYRQAAGIIHEEAERMGRLIDGLLDLARLEAGVAQMRREPLELLPWLRALAEPFAARAQVAGLTFEGLFEEPLPVVQADAARLEQAVGNLLANAIKYTPAGGHVALKARATRVRRRALDPPLPGRIVVGHRALRDGPWLAIQVTDTGRGIAAEDLGRIFDRFFRADKARAEASGSGLGLAIVREIVVAHGGLVAVQSSPGQGSTFTLLLPVA